MLPSGCGPGTDASRASSAKRLAAYGVALPVFAALCACVRGSATRGGRRRQSHQNGVPGQGPEARRGSSPLTRPPALSADDRQVLGSLRSRRCAGPAASSPLRGWSAATIRSRHGSAGARGAICKLPNDLADVRHARAGRGRASGDCLAAGTDRQSADLPNERVIASANTPCPASPQS